MHIICFLKPLFLKKIKKEKSNESSESARKLFVEATSFQKF